MLAVITVNSALDNTIGGDGLITLREALNDANATVAHDTITFDPTVFNTPQTITLTSAAGGQLSITQSVTIDASMLSNGVTIHAAANSRILNITGSGTVTLNSLSLTGGNLIENRGDGGAIRSTAPLIVIGCAIYDNQADFGGGISLASPSGTSEIVGSNIANNVAKFSSGAGGGIRSTGQLVIRGGTTIQNNQARYGAGVSATSSLLTVENCTITGNLGPGIVFKGYYESDQLNVVSSTISNNLSFTDSGGTLRSGGGVSISGGSATIHSSLITGNESQTRGGGIFFEGRNLNLQSSMIRDNTSGGSGGGLFAGTTNGAIVIEQSNIDLNRSIGGFSDGGGAYLRSTNSQVTITDTIASNNQAMGAEANVGGIAVVARNGSSVFIDSLTVVENHADDDIGGLLIENTESNVLVRNSVISGNTASHNSLYDAGGGAWLSVYDSGSTTLEYSTISNNRTTGVGDNVSGAGLLIANDPGTTTTIRNSTISGNEASGSGGGIQLHNGYDGGHLLIQHSTIANNRADSNNDGVGLGGGIHVGNSTTLVVLDHTIVAGNFRGTESTRSDISGAINASWSLIGDNTGSTIANNDGNQIGTGGSPISPGLLPLAFNGGPTMTHALAVGSPAIDAGNTSAVPGSGGVPLYDQRGAGFPRRVDVPSVSGTNLRIDIGAYEVGLAKVVDVRLDNPTEWTRDPFSFAAIVPTGGQLAPIYTQNISTLQIVFSEGVNVQKTHLTLYGSNGRVVAPLFTPDGFEHAVGSHIATWKFNPADLYADKYRIEISTAVTDLYGNALDGEWDNPTNGTPDRFVDDPTGRQLVSGNGSPGSTSNHFEFWFSILPGDYNQNGRIDAADDDVGVVKDGDGDGDSDSDDAQTATSILNTSTPYDNGVTASRNRGDYNDDELVSRFDYDVWKMTYGNTGPDLPADGNANGVVDAADYNAYRDHSGDYSAWSGISGSGGGGIPIVQFGIAPQVANVTISGSESTHNPYSFDAHDGSGAQLRTVPVGGADTISITFTEDVNISAGTLQVIGLRTANRPTLAEFSYDISAMTATWRFEDWTANDHYLISLSDAVTDVEGDRLDGEWINPSNIVVSNVAVSEFPSGDGTAGGDFNFVITMLAADAQINNVVNITDYYVINSNSTNPNLQNAVFTQGDTNGDGLVNAADLETYMASVGTSLTWIWVLADLNHDGGVDDEDVEILYDNWYNQLQNPTQAEGDLDADGDIDIDDLDLIFTQYGLQLEVVS